MKIIFINTWKLIFHHSFQCFNTQEFIVMRIHIYALCFAVIGLPSCTWVEPTKEGLDVTLVKPYNVETCIKLGETTASVKHQIGPVTRSEEKVVEELVTLARNKAAEMGGDSIVTIAPVKDGVMSFEVYKCAE